MGYCLLMLEIVAHFSEIVKRLPLSSCGEPDKSKSRKNCDLKGYVLIINAGEGLQAVELTGKSPLIRLEWPV
jgi:hypothetical protein